MRYLAAELSWPRVKALADAGALALLPIGSTEAHGPHLPLAVDVIIAEEVCTRVSTRLAFDVVQFPSVAYSLTDFAAPFAGTVTLTAETSRALFESTFRGIADAGFRRIGVVNHHLEPAHFRCVHDAAKAVNASLGESRVIVADHRRAPTGPELGNEFMHGGSHAGHYETSLMLVAAPQLVDDSARASLPELAVDLPAKIKAGAKNFLECGGSLAYLGAPALASTEEGERLFRILVDHAVGVFGSAGR